MMAAEDTSSKLLVKNLPPDATEDDVILFFECSRFCPEGGEVKAVELLENNEAVITFLESNTVDRLFHHCLVMQDTPLIVERLVNRSLEERPADHRRHSHGYNKQLVNELSVSDQSEDEGEIQKEKQLCDLEIYQNNEITNTKDSEDCLTILDQGLSSDDQGDIIKDIIDDKEEFQCSVRNTDISNTRSDESHEISEIAHSLNNIETIREEMNNSANEIEAKIKMSNDEFQLTNEKVKLLTVMRDSNSFDVCSVTARYDVQNGKISLTGSHQNVLDAKLSLLQTASAMVSSRIDLKKQTIQLLCSEQGSQWLDQKFLGNPTTTIYAVVYGYDDHAYVLASSDDQLEMAHQHLKEILSHTVIQFQNDHVDYLKSEGWIHHVEALNCNEIISISTDFDESKIIIEGYIETVSSVSDGIAALLKTHSKVQETIGVSKGTACLLKVHRETITRVIDDGMRASTCQKVELDFKEIGIDVCGTREAVEKAKEIIHDKYIVAVHHEKYQTNILGISIDDFVTKDSYGEDIIESLQMKHKCVIEVHECDEISGYMEEGNASAGAEAMSSKLWNVVSAAGAIAKAAYNYAISSEPNALKASSSNSSIPNIAKNITVHCGSLIDFQADVLVNPIAANTTTLKKAGAVSASFFDKGKDVLQQEFLRSGPPQHFGEGVTVTSNAGGIFSCKNIYHVAIRHFKNRRSIELLQQSIEECIKKAEQDNWASIAFPTLGCGKLSFSPDDVMNCFNKVALKSSLQIYIIGFDKPTCDTFDLYFKSSELRKTKSETGAYQEDSQNVDVDSVTESSTEARLLSSPSFEPLHLIPQSLIHKTVVFHIVALNASTANSAWNALVKKLKEVILDVKVDNEVIANLNGDAINKIKQLAVASKIHLEFDQIAKTIRLAGHHLQVNQAKSEIKQFLTEEKRNRDDIQYIKRTQGVAAYLSKLAANEDVKLPVYWSHYKKYDETCHGSRRSTVSPDTELYKALEAIVMKTWDSDKAGAGKDATGLNHSQIVIKNIYLIENLTMYRNYVAQLKTLCYKASNKPFKLISGLHGEGEVATKSLQGVNYLYEKLISEVNEYYLLHGSSHVDTLVSSGIDARFSSDKVLFGRGAYFAERSTKADQYADDKDARKPKGQILNMFIARTLLGEPFICQNPANYRKPPCSQCQNESCNTNGHCSCDSVIGTHKNTNTRLLFREFIIYHPDQSYPEFLVEYIRQ